MFQPIQIETQSEQQGLTHLHRQRATWGASREFSFDRREQALDQGAAAVKPSWEGTPHLGTHSVYAPGFLPPLGGNHALRSEAFADEGVIALAVELRVRQHQPDAGLLGSSFDDGRQICAVVPRPSPTSASAARAAVSARDDACAAQRTCSPRLAPNRWRPRRREPASAFGAANHAAGAPFRQPRGRWSGRRDAAKNDTGW